VPDSVVGKSQQTTDCTLAEQG